ncbi:Cytosolic Fe-S cluster assembly factor NARFL [Hondaea fermentalgiana]|uniref:Cytosolic Fe-S cluster assembly factor NARFL n=1 Tax=Hondaea fermentalgiana TaxID=2315210 RepID=A0A2R5GLB7_9STRA|nr:Cytosolic Fe-S cluster assembly factor NARFL [Hondaea fermentalgiana]|eukprot:GBG31099.1 Cytosolic Fe-S cluster assembly factor NARFL [Hondaea fermentalgiana]
MTRSPSSSVSSMTSMVSTLSTAAVSAIKPQAHLAGVADRAYASMLAGPTRQTQTIMVNGESGAGKTEAAKFITRCLARKSRKARSAAAKASKSKVDNYFGKMGLGSPTTLGRGGRRGARGGRNARSSRGLAALSPRPSSIDSEIGSAVEEFMISVSPVFEAFGNAKTEINHNSSRFGKFLQLDYDRDGVLIGAQTRHFLLEKTRVVGHAPHQRNFHVFYQLLAAIHHYNENASQTSPANSTKRRDSGSASDADGDLNAETDENDAEHEFTLGPVSESYAYLEPSAASCNAAEAKVASTSLLYGQDDEAKMQEVCKALDEIGVDVKHRKFVWRALLCILEVGNLSFVAADRGHGLDGCKLDRNGGRAAAAVDRVAQFLGVDIEDLDKNLCFRTVSAGGPKRTSVLLHPLTAAEAMASRDGLAKALYTALFDFVVSTVNLRINAGNAEKQVAASIGLLDVFGFEMAQRNSFEQLCMNYANEKLQHKFEKHLVAMERAFLEDEGLDADADMATFHDSSAVIASIDDKSIGIFAVLDEASALHLDDAAFIAALRGKLEQQCADIKATKTGQAIVETPPQQGALSFVVRHRAGDLEYDVRGFVEKNTDAMQADVADMLLQSRNAFVARLVQASTASASANLTSSTAAEDLNLADALPAVGGQRHSLRMAVETGKAVENFKATRTMASTKTISALFRKQLSHLDEAMDAGAVHFVRCIRPCNLPARVDFDGALVLNQLHHLSVLEMVRFRLRGFCERLPLESFFIRFCGLAASNVCIPDGASGLRRSALSLLRRLFPLAQDADLYRVGLEHVLFRPKALHRLDVLERIVKTFAASTIQTWARTTVLVDQDRLDDAATKVQTLWRAWRCVQEFDVQRDACIPSKISRWYKAIISARLRRANEANQTRKLPWADSLHTEDVLRHEGAVVCHFDLHRECIPRVTGVPERAESQLLLLQNRFVLTTSAQVIDELVLTPETRVYARDKHHFFIAGVAPQLDLVYAFRDMRGRATEWVQALLKPLTANDLFAQPTVGSASGPRRGPLQLRQMGAVQHTSDGDSTEDISIEEAMLEFTCADSAQVLTSFAEDLDATSMPAVKFAKGDTYTLEIPKILQRGWPRIKSNANAAESAFHRCACNMERRWFCAAIHDAEMALLASPQNAKAHLRKGLALMELRLEDRARASLEEAINLDADLVEARTILANLDDKEKGHRMCTIPKLQDLRKMRKLKLKRNPGGSRSIMSGFASSVLLGDLNDFISPSQACVNPIFAGDKAGDEGAGNKNAAEVEKLGLPKIGLQLENDFGAAMDVETTAPTPNAPDLIKTSAQKTAQVSLSDCLACSGCVTSAETVLIEQQSADEFERKVASGQFDAIVVTLSAQSRASLAAHFGVKTATEMQERVSTFLRSRKRVSFVLDATVAGDLALIEQSREFIHRYRSQQGKEGSHPWEAPPTSAAVSCTTIKMDPTGPTPEEVVHGGEVRPGALTPLLASACPGWICYAEKSCPEAIPYISTTKSPQQIAGALVKDWVSKQTGVAPGRILHATVMPCADKKLEASRNDFFRAEADARDVDCVLTTTELANMMVEDETDEGDVAMLDDVHEAGSGPLARRVADSLASLSEASAVGVSAADGGSGGYVEYVFRTAAKELFGVDVPSGPLPFKQGRNADIRTVELHVQGKPALRFATAYGFRNIQQIVRQLKRGKCRYDYVEIMACPGGCLNGGGQARPEVSEVDMVVSEATKAAAQRERLGQASEIFHSRPVRPPEDNPHVQVVYQNYIGGEPFGEESRRLLHTRYHTVPKLESGLTQSW